MGRLKLFDDGDDDDDGDKIEIDREFANRYEHNKKREDLQRYEEIKKNGKLMDSGSDSDDSTSSEEYVPLEQSKKSDYAYFDALLKIKNQDPDLKNKDVKLFDSESESEDESGSNDGKVKKGDDGKRGERPMYLKDVVSKHLIEVGPEFDDEEMGNKIGHDASKVKTYAEEQEEFRRDVLKAIEEEEEDVDEAGDFLKVKEAESLEEEQLEEVGNKLDEYFGKDEKLDEDAMFLKEYFRNRMWLSEGKSESTRDEEIDYSEDEEEIERQEDYERDFNFRFEENAGDRVLGHSRKVEGSIRKKKDNSRKLQRESKNERIAQAELERAEELKHLKNLKKKEINDKLQKIREVSGIEKGGRSLLDGNYLEKEFDPDEYDRKMKEAFDKDYYEAEDVDPEFGSGSDENEDEFQKPDFDKEDELLGLAKGWDEVEEFGEGILSARQRIMNDNAINIEGENELIDRHDVGKRKRKRKPSEVEKAVREQLMEEYYKLDYEDTVGDLKTRFKYKQVKAKRFGLNSDEMLRLDEKDLNQYVSLKKLAPYREEEWKVPRVKTMQFKQMSKELLNGGTSASTEKDTKKKNQPDGEEPVEVVRGVDESHAKALNSDMGNASRQKKRRLRQAELKPSHSRRMAYGNIPSNSKKKMK